ncbi:hypothetical protein [Streptomyces alkaliphilus]|uniref:SAV-6107-like HEPN domain-containing protein n=1 Tax=Streptomyces alkaliphilus TaxID=1472722 RepID=A0A7W3TDW3_9ACTN|nr:hypothetical protein [Streptomyces alkaliphilus]MBB0244892.1 hypothetical protein [Streptomyces alkaliphilus]MQS08236.1 hypothetical protein [Streptomyces alkaliphilus]
MRELPSPAEVRAHVLLALDLANHGRAEGEVAEVLAHRLRDGVRALAEPARRWATGRSDVAERAGHLTTIRRAVEIADAGSGLHADPAHSLRMLAKAVDVLARMAGAEAGRKRQGEAR